MKMKALSVAVSEFKDKATGKPTTMYEVYCSAPNGKVGSIYTPKAVRAGDEVDVGIDVKDGKFRLKIL